MELSWRQKASFFMEVTPTIAAYWLEHQNTQNRDMSEWTVDGYARDMSAGLWQSNGEAITFDWNGVLVDGQQRLAAIVKAGMSVEELIVTGLNPACRPTVDIHRKRNVKDAFDLSGHGDLVSVGNVPKNTAAGMWARMKHGLGGSKGKETRQELLAFAVEHRDAGTWALDQFGKHKRTRKVVLAPSIAAVARATYYYPDRLYELARFVEVLCTGIQRSPDDRGVIVLRETLLDGRGMSGRNSNVSSEIYGKTARAIQAYMSGQILQKFYVPTSDPFPLPDRKATAASPRVDRVAGNIGGHESRESANDLLAPIARH